MGLILLQIFKDNMSSISTLRNRPGPFASFSEAVIENCFSEVKLAYVNGIYVMHDETREYPSGTPILEFFTERSYKVGRFEFGAWIVSEMSETELLNKLGPCKPAVLPTECNVPWNYQFSVNEKRYLKYAGPADSDVPFNRITLELFREVILVKKTEI